MSPLLATETSIIVEKLNALIQNIEPPSPFELAQLDRDIDRLANADIVASQCFRGVYYALQGDLKNVGKWFDMAINITPSDPFVYLNYAVALSYLREYEQATKMALKGVSMDSSENAIYKLLLCAYYADDLAILDEWLPKYEKLTGEPHQVAAWLQEDAEDEAELPAIIEEARNSEPIPWERVKEELGL